MFTQESNIQAGKVWNINAYGTFFYLLDCPQAVDVLLKKNGATVYEAKGVDSGFYVKEKEFTSIDIYASVACTAKIGVSTADGGYNRMGGTVSLNGTVTESRDSIMAHSAPQSIGTAPVKILNADANRRGFRLLNDSAATIYIGGATLTLANGVMKLNASGYLDEDKVTTGEVWAVASAAASPLRVMEIF